MARFPTLWREPLALTRRFDRLFDEFFRDWDWPFESSALGRTDIYEQAGNLIYETELPGVKRDDIHIQVEEGQLIVTGETKREERVEEENYLRMGRRIGKFRRTFPLPEEIDDPKKIEAHFEDGILRVEVPLKTSLKGKERPIEIKVK